MNTNIKITIIAAAALFLQSCNMAKHYGHMRISHSKEEITEKVTETKTDTENVQAPQTNKTAALTDGIVPMEIGSTETDSVTKSIIVVPTVQKNTKSTKAIVKNEKPGLKPIKKVKQKIKSVIKPKLKLRKPGASQNEMTIDDWGYIAIGLTIVAFIVLIIITGSFLAALVLAVQFFLAILSLIAIGAILYVVGQIFSFLGGGFF